MKVHNCSAVRLSLTTTRLQSAAHAIGDQYYRSLSDLLCSHLGDEKGCEALAISYLNALDDLEKHLSTLKKSKEVSLLKIATGRYIDLVHDDLKMLQKTRSKKKAA